MHPREFIDLALNAKTPTRGTFIVLSVRVQVPVSPYLALQLSLSYLLSAHVLPRIRVFHYIFGELIILED